MSLLSLPLPPPLPASFQESSLPPIPEESLPMSTPEISRPPSPRRTVVLPPVEPVVLPSETEISRPPSPRRTVVLPPEEVKSHELSVNLEDELKKYGYIIKEKVVIHDEDETLMAKYIKAVNPNGHKVFIDPDVEALVPVITGQQPFLEAKDVTIQPYSLKHGVMESAGLQARGIAFECHNGICTLLRNEGDLRPVEESFIIPSSKLDDTPPILYPIVRMSDIQANPSMVLKNTEDVTKRLRNAIYQKAQLEMKKSHETVKRLDKAFTDLDKSVDESMKNISKSLRTLDGYKRQYVGMVLDPLNAQKYRGVIDNLYIRHEMMADLLQVIEASELERTYLEEHIKKLKELTRYVKTEFSDVNYVL